MGKAMQRVAGSQVVQLVITLITYSFYACIIGLSAGPSIYFVVWAWRAVAPFGLWSWALFSLCAGASLYMYFIVGIVVMGLSIRLLSLGIKPGVYADASPTMLRWLIFSGVYTLARGTILPMAPMTWFLTAFFKLIGCKIGKNVYLNSWSLNDAYLMELGDDVTIGGDADLSCHIYEKGRLILEPIRIGKGSLIGAHAYISPGVTIGENCVVGLNSYVRRGKTIPSGAKYTSLAGLPMREMLRIERSGRPLRVRDRGPGMQRERFVASQELRDTPAECHR